MPGGRGSGPPGQLRVIVPLLLLPRFLWPSALGSRFQLCACGWSSSIFCMWISNKRHVSFTRGSAGTRPLFKPLAGVCVEKVSPSRPIDLSSLLDDAIRGIRIAARHGERQVRCLRVRKGRRMPVSPSDAGQSPASASSGPVLRASIACSISSTMFSSPTLLSKMIGMSYGTR